MIVDTSALLAFFDRNEPAHRAVAEAFAGADSLVVSPYVVAELDYLVATRIGREAELAVLEELTSGAWDLSGFDIEDVRQARALIARYPDQDLGIADASIAVLAHRYATTTVATLDRRHFAVLRPLDGSRFEIVP